MQRLAAQAQAQRDLALFEAMADKDAVHAQALREVTGPGSGRCTAVLLVGEAIPAAQAAETLLGREPDLE